MLSVMIEGESLLNDGVAILFYEIFEEIITGGDSSGSGDLAVEVVKKFFVIAVGGPIFGKQIGRASCRERV